MQNTQHWDFRADEVRAIQVEADAGEINLLAEEGMSIKAELTGDYNSEKTVLTMEIKDSKLILTVKSRKKWFCFGGSCKNGFKITAPAKTLLTVMNGAGRVIANGFTAGAEISSGAGEVVFQALSGPIRVKSGAGSVSGDIYSEDLEVKSGAGAVNLSWTQAPRQGSALVKNGAGSTTLAFPAGSKVAVKFKSGVGSMTNELGDTPSAPFKVEVKSGAGSLAIKKR
ncbi:MAG: hypothetical protein Q7R35_15155 [Elusimicrobiota bacterium]|nr:hypothetical protein [Elusimicrobiota bacterium]